jgi:hypothetical protein
MSRVLLWCRVVGLRWVAAVPLLALLAVAGYSLATRGDDWALTLIRSLVGAWYYLSVMHPVYAGRYDP